jgi:DNA-binding transcriptional ArsR family regulator
MNMQGGNLMAELYADYVPILKAISDETRLKIIDMLSCGEMCACDILEEFSISQSALSYHMKILSESGLVNAVRDGAWMRYTLNKDKTNEVISFFNQITSDKKDCICKKCKDKVLISNLKEDFIMKKIEIFDPAMCCSTGVCGPSIDPELMRIATVISSLKEKGVIIQRHGLSTDPQEFISNQVINDILQKDGAEVLPITLVDGLVAKTKGYPTNEELSKWLEIEIDAEPKKKSGGCGCGSEGCC